MLVYQDGKTLARVGVMGESADIRDAPILRKCIREGRDGREQYLAALQVCCAACRLVFVLNVPTRRPTCVRSLGYILMLFALPTLVSAAGTSRLNSDPITWEGVPAYTKPIMA